MARNPDQTQEQASKEATDWLILLQEEPNDLDLRRRFADWLHRSPLNAAAWTATEHASSVIESVPPAYAERWQPHLDETRSTDTKVEGADPTSPTSEPAVPAFASDRATGRLRQAFGRRRGLQIAGLAVAACLALVFVPDMVLQIRSDYATGRAETRTVALDDGSTVILAPDSAIAIVYSDRERRIDLLAGEAFFAVTANPDRPFRVAAGDIRTTVIGTGFAVRRSDDGAVVAVEHGTVQVDYEAVSPPVSERLEAGQSVHVGWLGKMSRRDGQPGQVAAWRKRQLIAQDEPMGEVIDQLRRYYGGTIIVTDAVLGDRPVTGVYNLSDPVDALRAIAQAHGATVRQITPWILVVSGL